MTGFSKIKEPLDHLKRLEELGELARRFHSSGLTSEELGKPLDLLSEAIIHVTGRSDLHLLKTIKWFNHPNASQGTYISSNLQFKEIIS